MKGIIGNPTRYFTLNEFRPAASIKSEPSLEAKHRLKVVDFYYKKSSEFTKNGKRSYSVTARRFGHCVSYVIKWVKRFKKGDLTSLESHSRRPKNVRVTKIPSSYIERIRKIREEYPLWSGRKIYVVLKKLYGDESYSARTIDRIIKKYDFHFAMKTKKRKQRRRPIINREFKNKGLKATEPNEIIEFDLKHVRLFGIKLYAFCAIDVFTRVPLVHISSSCKSSAAKIAIEKVIERYGEGITILNDNGSENLGEMRDYLKERNIKQIFAHPNIPQDKPHIERFIGSLQREFLDEWADEVTVEKLQKEVDLYIKDFVFLRPHAGIGYKTPEEFCNEYGINLWESDLNLA